MTTVEVEDVREFGFASIGTKAVAFGRRKETIDFLYSVCMCGDPTEKKDVSQEDAEHHYVNPSECDGLHVKRNGQPRAMDGET